MPGISFDRAAEYYDATRGYAPGVAERIRDAIVAYTGATTQSRFLELGVGTGRIALPFIQAGYSYTGIDISEPMMDRLRAKLAAEPDASGYRYDLRQGDVSALPFADNSFDVVLAVHVLHLVGDRTAVMREAGRVLRPGGFFLTAHDGPASDEGGDDTPIRQVRSKWFELLSELQTDVPIEEISRWIDDEQLADELVALGASAQVVRLATYERPGLSVRGLADLIKGRRFSSDWRTPDDVHAEASRRLECWIAEQYPDAEELLTISGDFTAVIARWPEAPGQP